MLSETLSTLPEFLSSKEFAALINVHEESVRRACRNGELPSIRVGTQWRIARDVAFADLLSKESTLCHTSANLA